MSLLDRVVHFQKGNVYVVEFWATWCQPCIAGMPHLSRLQEKYAKDGVFIISVTNESADVVDKFLSARHVATDKTYREITSNY